ncbi:kelch-like protein 10 [Saccoglossus kowalevskii]|uniref:Kelch-like protein 10-like n=1 Tax=Saccoglossus kowalevskii TaxID=10224 RepID=A0ABM0H0N4_SACKO|nr:PREDICTED: kelch-like protein 10-like [Saccoglossus kowalevskii]
MLSFRNQESDDRVEKKISVAACNVFRELRQNRQLCDIVIQVEGQEFPAHRNILSACSPYFRALFTNGMNETLLKTVKIPGVSIRTMDQIIDYAYTREVVITESNVVDLVVAADQFHCLGIVEKCADFLADRLSSDNCIGIRRFAQSYYIPSLEESAKQYLLKHFDTVSLNFDKDEFLELTCDELCEYISDDDLNVKLEETVFEAVIRWIDFDPENRIKHQYSLLSRIRLGLINPDYFISKVKCHKYIQDNEECKPLIIDTMKYLYDLSVHDQHYQNPLARPRVPYDVLYAVGGWSGGNPTNVVESYDTRADRWRMVDSTDNSPRAYHSVAVLNHFIYVIGGFDGNEYFNSCRCFDPVKRVWKEIAPMNTRRCYVSVTVCGRNIYAMGGFDGHTRTKSAERYTQETNQWSLIPNMNHHRSDACATALLDKVYICGGFNGQECLNTAESFDPMTDTWTNIPNMRSRRSGVGVVAYNGCVYAVGGFNGLSRLNTAERYSPMTNQWTTVQTMYVHRSNFGIAQLDEMIFVIGGFNGVTTIFNVECYDEKTNEWYDASDMTVFRSALSCAVVHGLPNRREYTWPRVSLDEDVASLSSHTVSDIGPATPRRMSAGTHRARSGNPRAAVVDQRMDSPEHSEADDEETDTGSDSGMDEDADDEDENRGPESGNDSMDNNGFALVHMA